MKRAVSRFGLAAVGLVLALQCVADDRQAWLVPEAPLRFQLNVTRSPTHPAAGYFVEIPDGGLLPDRSPLVTQIFTPDGVLVESYTLWHNPAGSLAIIMAAAGNEGRFTVYVQPSSRYRLWNPESGLAPSAILAADPTQASLRSANALAGLGRVADPVHFINKAGVKQAPLSIAGDESGRPRPASFYMLAHVVTTDPGRTWLAPFTLDGTGEVRVNGSTLNPRPRIDKWGGTGDWAELKPGLNRIEILHSAPGTEDFFTRKTGGLMYLTWRTPNATMQELGGVRSEAVLMTGTSRMETRLIREDEIVRSGACDLRRAEARDGRPVAAIRRREAKPYWFGDETPLLLYSFATIAPLSAARYTWTFPGGMVLEGPRAEWILPGFREHGITLSADMPGGNGTAAKYHFYAFSTRGTSLNSAEDRRDFRRALRMMAEAYPAGHRAVMNWDPALWRTLLRTTELGKGTPLLQVLFRKHIGALQQNIDTHEFEALQDVFLEAMARISDADSLAWAASFANETRDTRRKGEFAVRAAEITMYYRRDLERAESILRAIYHREQDDLQHLRYIRLGDLALLNGDLNLATRYYAGVQNETRIRRSVADRNVVAESGARAPARRARIGATMDQTRSDDWKLQALVDASASESIRALIAQGYLIEAREMLRLWERDLPLSKISSDFIILESMLYREVNDPVRALGLLRAFCDTVEASNALPEAAPLLLSLMIEAAEPSETIRAYGERFRKMLEFHPVAQELDRLMLSIPVRALQQKEAVPYE